MEEGSVIGKWVSLVSRYALVGDWCCWGRVVIGVCASALLVFLIPSAVFFVLAMLVCFTFSRSMRVCNITLRKNSKH